MKTNTDTNSIQKIIIDNYLVIIDLTNLKENLGISNLKPVKDSHFLKHLIRDFP